MIELIVLKNNQDWKMERSVNSNGQSSGTNILAVASLVLGIWAWLIFPIIAALPAIIMGHIARRKIKRTGEKGSGLAMAGLILGYANVFFILAIAGDINKRLQLELQIIEKQNELSQ